MQTTDPQWWEVIRHEFTESASWGATLRAALIVVGVFGLVALLDRLQRRRREPRDVDNPRRLYRRLLLRLELTAAQRSLLQRVARDLRLSNPTILLLGIGPFRDAVAAWSKPRHRPAEAASQFAQIEDLLFPHEQTRDHAS